MSSIITPSLIRLDADLGQNSSDVIRALAQRVVEEGRADDVHALFADAWAREQKDATGVPGGIAIPHCRSVSATEPTLAFARLSPTVDFGAPDGPADLVFLIAAPDGADEAHLQVLSSLARALVRPDFVAGLREAPDAERIVVLVNEVVAAPQSAAGAVPAASATPADPGAQAASAGAPAGTAAAAAVAPGEQATPGADSGRGRHSGPAADSAEVPDSAETAGSAGAPPARIVAVTACATGIAHTFMAADALTAAAQDSGIVFHVEPQGSSGYRALDPQVIAEADAVIFAVDVDVREPQRFAGKPLIRAGVKRGIEQPRQLLAEAVEAAADPQADRLADRAEEGAPETPGQPTTESAGARIKRWLLTGVSYMIPFVAGGGLLIALGFLLAGYTVTDFAADVVIDNSLWDLPAGGLGQYLGSVAFMIGSTSMGFLVPVLAGFVAFAIADRPGIAPGFVAGAVAVLMDAGFIGGIVGGLLAGFIAAGLGRLPAPAWLRGLMPVVIIPLIGSIVASGLLLLVLGRPIAEMMGALSAWLNGLQGAEAIALGAILGLMMCFDLGGPINKVAYTFGTAGLAAASLDNPAPYAVMAAVMISGMVPPLGLALATLLSPRTFSAVERENGKAAWLLGAAFISEGAIPFAAADPLRVLPASIAGGAAAGALSMAFGVQSLAPHGGVFVFFAINPIGGFLISLLVGTVITAVVVLVLKRWVGRRSPEEPVAAAQPEPAIAG